MPLMPALQDWADVLKINMLLSNISEKKLLILILLDCFMEIMAKIVSGFSGDHLDMHLENNAF